MPPGDAIAGLAVSLAYATAVLGVLSICAAIGWIFYVRHRTKIAAREEVEKVVPDEVRAYLDRRLQGMVAEAMAPFIDGLSATASAQTPEQQAEGLSEDSE